MGFKSPYNHVNQGNVTALRQRPISQRLLLLCHDQNHIRTRLLSHPQAAVSTLIRALNSLPSVKSDSILDQKLSTTCFTVKLSVCI